ncbi:hypothetical protein [Neorhodopirellula lusitana]|uniref:hypothetical protein n=1 Tax=Neorhodopirellula lusitana TaxID=445327 RepID=UPI0024B648C2|nr:hypothetical protein [Neorhodopirellula lusitana]
MLQLPVAHPPAPHPGFHIGPQHPTDTIARADKISSLLKSCIADIRVEQAKTVVSQLEKATTRLLSSAQSSNFIYFAGCQYDRCKSPYHGAGWQLCQFADEPYGG